MRKVRRKRHHHEGEELWNGATVKKAVAQKTADANSTAVGNLNQAAVMRLQGTHGNNYVQRFLAQRETAAPTAPPKLNKKVELQAPTSLSEDGTLDVDLSQLLNLRKFGSEIKPFADQIEEWGAFGQLILDEKIKHPFLEMEADKSGKVQFEMSNGFVQQIKAILTTGEAQDEPDLKDFCGAQGLKVTATLHYNLEDPEIKESKLELPAEMRSGAHKFLPQPVMLLTFEGEIKPLGGGKSIKLSGAALFQAELREEAAASEEE